MSINTSTTTLTPTVRIDPDGMKALHAAYLEWLAVRNYSEKTVKIRLLCVGYFIAWAEQRGVSKPGEVTPYTRSARTPSRRNRGRAILSVGSVRLDSVLQWWRRLLGVFPVGDSEPGSVSAPSLVTRPGAPRRDRVVPVCNRDV